MANSKRHPVPAFEVGQEKWTLSFGKFAKRKIVCVCPRLKEKDNVYFFEGMQFGVDSWYLEDELFDTKEEMIESMNG